MPDPYQTCTFCPRLCRHVCPVALATGLEAATPSAMMGAVYLARRGLLDPSLAGRAAAMCTACGACSRHCKEQVPVGDLLSQARSRYLPPRSPEALAPVEGDAPRVAVECDTRSWAGALARKLREPVARLHTSDHLGASCMDHPQTAEPQISSLARLLDGRIAITSCSACAGVLRRANLQYVWLHSLPGIHVPTPVLDSPTMKLSPAPDLLPGTLPCCGQGGILARSFPQLAKDLARECASRLPATAVPTFDSLFRVALTPYDVDIYDPIDILLGEAPAASLHEGTSKGGEAPQKRTPLHGAP